MVESHQSQNTLFAQLADTHQIDHFPRNRRQVDLEVTRVQNRTQRRSDGQRNRIRDRMVGVDKLHLKASQFDRISCADMVEPNLLRHFMLGKLGFDDPAGQPGGVNRSIALTQHIRDRADMILMPMGDDITAQLVQVALEISRIRNDQINAQHIVIRESHTAVDHDDITAVLDYGHVFADLIQTAERYDFQFFLHNSFITFLYHFIWI